MSEEKAAPKKSLVTKLAEVMGEVGRIAKTGRNNFHNYDYATEADIVESVRGAMSERGLMLLPSVEKTEWRKVPGKSGEQTVCTLTVKYRLLDGDSDSSLEFTILGEGQDQGDKATYKALTGATKYALLKLFLIPTGDDPENDAPRPSPKSAPPQQQRQAPSSSPLPATGRRTSEVKARLASEQRKMPLIQPDGSEWFEKIRALGKAHSIEGARMASHVKGCGITKTDPATYTEADFNTVAASMRYLGAGPTQ